jgi:tRNA (cytidine/uridine-2'-O-)-methyltransferase
MFHIVLYTPEIPPNTGNAIRLCANTGATLHLVKPLGFRLDDKSLRRGGLDYHDLADLKVHENLDTCFATLGESRIVAVETGGRIRYSDFEVRPDDAFVFGPETRGLPAAVRNRIGCENSLSLPMRPKCRSINLSNAVAVVAFDAWRQLDFPGAARGPPD